MYRRILFAATVFVVAGFPATPVWARGLSALGRDEKAALVAEATAEARAQITRRIRALPIDAGITVGDLAASSPQIDASLNAFIVVIKPAGPPRWDATDTQVEVVVEIRLEAVYHWLKGLDPSHYRSVTVAAANLAERIAEAGDRSIRQVGRASVGGKAPKAVDALPMLWRTSVLPEGVRAAEDSARTYARCNLLRQIKLLRVNAGVTVEDFAAISKDIADGIDKMALAAKQQGKSVLRPRELIVDVTVAKPARDVYTQLRTLHGQYYKGTAVTDGDFALLIETAGSAMLAGAGSGVPPGRFLTVGPQTRAGGPALPRRPSWPVKLSATGKAGVAIKGKNVAQAKLKALRQAESTAREDLARRLRELQITAKTCVGDFVCLDKRIDQAMTDYLQTARLVGAKIYDGTGAVAVVEIHTDELWNMIVLWQRKLAIRIE
ncbi:MAG: hypothetical protein HQ546_01695 [Planctomycetes bacterium]|nr:hypothetical protein [Planctomycetota bacterium]